MKITHEVRILKLIARNPGLRAANLTCSQAARQYAVDLLRAKGLMHPRKWNETAHTELLHLTRLGEKIAAIEGLSNGESVTNAIVILRGLPEV